MKKQLIISTALAMLLLLCHSSPVLADDDPDSVSISDIGVYRHLIEDDDWLGVVPYSIPYTVLPDQNIDDLYIFRLLNSDNSSQIGTILAYPYDDGGYGDGMVSFYFTAATAPSWDTVYIVQVEQNPVYFDTPQEWTFYLPVSAYESATTQAGQQAALQTKVIGLAQDLTVSWGVALLTEGEITTVLSTYGEAYFRNAILGLQTMCPNLFSIELTPMTPDSRSWDYTLANELATRYNGTFWGNAMTGFAGLFGVGTGVGAGIMALFFVVLIMGLATIKLKVTTSSAFLHGFAALDLMTLMGLFSLVIHGLITFLSAMVIGVVIFLNRA